MAGQDKSDMSNLLRWSIENSSTARDTDTATPNQPPPAPRSQLDMEALRKFVLGGPSDADRMKEAMAAILHPEVSMENKEIAFDNFEQLVEGIDNANNIEALGLWQPLVDLLDSEQAELRKWTAWCMATAVSNNIKAQEKLHVLDAIPKLVKQATEDSEQDARKKAILALSSGVRNYQPNLDKAVQHIPKEHLPQTDSAIDATNMDAVDLIISNLREHSAKKG